MLSRRSCWVFLSRRPPFTSALTYTARSPGVEIAPPAVQAQDGVAVVSLIGLSVPSRAAGNWAAGTAYESIVATFVPNWYPCAWGLGIEASVFAGNELCLSPSGSKMRFWNA